MPYVRERTISGIQNDPYTSPNPPPQQYMVLPQPSNHLNLNYAQESTVSPPSTTKPTPTRRFLEGLMPTRDANANNEYFIHAAFPGHSNAEGELREKLREIFRSVWWMQNLHEPEEAFAAFIEKVENHSYRCRICPQENCRPDRAVAHFRKHIDHRPFRCTGRNCRSVGRIWFVV